MFKVRDRLRRMENSSKEERSYVQSEGQAEKEGKIVSQFYTVRPTHVPDHVL